MGIICKKSTPMTRVLQNFMHSGAGVNGHRGAMLYTCKLDGLVRALRQPIFHVLYGREPLHVHAQQHLTIYRIHNAHFLTRYYVRHLNMRQTTRGVTWNSHCTFRCQSRWWRRIGEPLKWTFPAPPTNVLIVLLFNICPTTMKPLFSSVFEHIIYTTPIVQHFREALATVPKTSRAREHNISAGVAGHGRYCIWELHTEDLSPNFKPFFSQFAPEVKMDLFGASLEHLWSTFGASLDALLSFIGASLELLWRLYKTNAFLTMLVAWSIKPFVFFLIRQEGSSLSIEPRRLQVPPLSPGGFKSLH